MGLFRQFFSKERSGSAPQKTGGNDGQAKNSIRFYEFDCVEEKRINVHYVSEGGEFLSCTG